MKTARQSAQTLPRKSASRNPKAASDAARRRAAAIVVTGLDLSEFSRKRASLGWEPPVWQASSINPGRDAPRGVSYLFLLLLPFPLILIVILILIPPEARGAHADRPED